MSKQEARFIENTDAVGLRWVGWADELANLRHTGWFTDDEGMGETLRGCVYALPARNGKRVLIPAYREGGEHWGRWTDQNTGSAILFPGDITDDEDTAAHWADSNAEHAAEKEREYNEAWQAGSRYAALGDDLGTMRADLRSLLSEMREERGRDKERPSLCAALRSHIRTMLSDMDSARRERADLYEQFDTAWSKDLRAAFRDGASL